ncbi:MAG: hypothetical protein AAAB11_08160, partial [Rhizobium giardinii]
MAKQPVPEFNHLALLLRFRPSEARRQSVGRRKFDGIGQKIHHFVDIRIFHLTEALNLSVCGQPCKALTVSAASAHSAKGMIEPGCRSYAKKHLEIRT